MLCSSSYRFIIHTLFFSPSPALGYKLRKENCQIQDNAVHTYMKFIIYAFHWCISLCSSVKCFAIFPRPFGWPDETSLTHCGSCLHWGQILWFGTLFRLNTWLVSYKLPAKRFARKPSKVVVLWIANRSNFTSISSVLVDMVFPKSFLNRTG